MTDEAMLVIPSSLEDGGIPYAIARLVEQGGEPDAEALLAVPDMTSAPPMRIALSRYGLAKALSAGILSAGILSAGILSAGILSAGALSGGGPVRREPGQAGRCGRSFIFVRA